MVVVQHPVRNLTPWLILLVVACGSDPSGPNQPPPGGPAETPVAVVIAAGNSQSAAPSTEVSVAPAVVVRDSAGHGVPDVQVTFSVLGGGGVVTEGSATTNAEGVATVAAWRLGPMPAENRLQASVPSLPSVQFTATGRYLVSTAPVSGVVTLPSGSQLGVATLRVETGIADVPVGANGAFTASALPGGVQLAAAHAANGEPVLMGWFDATHRSLSARTTAEVMLYFALGGYTLPEAARRDALRTFLTTFDLNALTIAIDAAIKGDPSQVSLDTPGIRQARNSVLLVLRSAAATPRGIIIEPAGEEQSGINVDQVGLNNIVITNHWRRRVVAFVDRVSHVRKGMAGAVPSASPGQPINLGSVAAATSVIGTGVDILFGNMAWEPVVSSPEAVALSPADAVATRYRVTVVGPGTRTAGVTLSPLQQSEQVRVSVETLLLEAVLPMLDQILGADKELQSIGNDKDIGSLVAEFLDVMPVGAVEKAAGGDFQGALQETWKTLLDSGPGQDLLLNSFLTTIKAKGISAEVAFAKAKRWARILAIVEAIATMGDLYYVVEHSTTGQDAVTWDVHVGEANIKLTPEHALISNLDTELFRATVLDATDGGPAPVFHYRWSTTGNVGKICAQFAECGTSIPSSSRDVISYAPDVLKEGADQVKVVVFYVEDGKEHVIGEATSEITTYAPKVEIAPEQSSIDYDEQVQLTVTVDPRLLDDGVIRYHWSTAGSLGTFLFGQTTAETINKFITYTATRHIEGTETVTVSVTSTKNGTTRNLGSATATILVEHQRPTIVMGSWTISEPRPLDAGRSCVTAYISVPLIVDAKSYEVRAYGFNDTAYWGNQINFGVTPPTPAYAPCGPGWGQSGTVGNEYRYFLTGFAGPNSSIASAIASASSRFAGMQVEVTVRY